MSVESAYALADEAEWFLTPGHPLRDEVRRDPYPFYKRLRVDQPVIECSENRWLVTRYDDVVGILRDRDTWSRLDANERNTPLVPGKMTAVHQMTRFNMLRRDPPDHTRLRRSMAQIFGPRSIGKWRARVANIANELIADARQKESFDFYVEIANRLPLIVICEMLGVPNDRIEDFERWAATTLADLEPGEDPEDLQRIAEEAAASSIDFFNDLLNDRADRRERPDDLLSYMVGLEDDTLSRAEMISMAIMLHIAGYETTANLTTNGLLTLLRNPGQFELLRSNPELVPTAVEEMLRYDSPARNAMSRIATTDVKLGETSIPRDATVVAILGSANRDSRYFEDPDRFDITRTPNPHIAFGTGIHACLGSHLARIELQALFSELISGPPMLTLTSEPEWRDSFVLRALEGLSVSWCE